MSDSIDIQAKLDGFRTDFEALKHEIGKVVVGQEDVINGVLTALVSGGHVLIEGLPGLGKTVLVRTLADVLDLSFQRIQCTPDLMPTDVIGTYVIMETPQGRRTFEFQKGPLFANIVLADQVNRAMPKTQSALLEAMDEDTVTVSTETFHLPDPYFVIATQNPLEMEGTYPLPEAQIDRFFFKLVVTPPDCDQIEQILERTTGITDPALKTVADAARIREMGELARQVGIADNVRRWAISVVAATHPQSEQATGPVKKYVRHGCSPRAAQAMVLGAKVAAILEGRRDVSVDDIRAVAHAALRHRLILNFDAQAEDVEADDLIDGILDKFTKP